MNKRVPRILIIEDDSRLRLTYVSTLKQAGYEVCEASGGETGLTMAEELRPDIIVLDLMMPKMDGFEFLEKYDVKDKHIDVSVIVYSQSMLTEMIDRAMALGAKKYLEKSFKTPQVLQAAIEEIMHARQEVNERIRSL
jgi:CheY-like chemotaxis protein